jgi:hypothetical protein
MASLPTLVGLAIAWMAVTFVNCKTFYNDPVSGYQKCWKVMVYRGLSTAATLGIGAAICFGAVGEGDLPAGSLAYAKLLKYQVISGVTDC